MSETTEKTTPVVEKKVVEKRVVEFPPRTEVLAKMEQRFVKTEDVVNILYSGAMTGKNVILYGRGGHAKSEMSTEFFKILGVTPFVQTCNNGLTEEKLFGGMNMKALKEEGKINYLVEHSFMEHEFVIFEELFDAPARTLLSLKDIITSGEFRMGDQQVKIKTRFIVCCTNRSRKEIAADESIKALLERFPLEWKVEWKEEEYNAKEYFMMMQKVLPQTKYFDKLLVSHVIQLMKESGQFVSPRTAIHAAQLVSACGESYLKYLADFPEALLEKVIKPAMQKAEEEVIKVAKEQFEANHILKYYIEDTVYTRTGVDIVLRSAALHGKNVPMVFDNLTTVARATPELTKIIDQFKAAPTLAANALKDHYQKNFENITEFIAAYEDFYNQNLELARRENDAVLKDYFISNGKMKSSGHEIAKKMSVHLSNTNSLKKKVESFKLMLGSLGSLGNFAVSGEDYATALFKAAGITANPKAVMDDTSFTKLSAYLASNLNFINI